MIYKQSNGKMEVKYAYGMIPSPRTGKTSEQWCRQHQIECCATMEELIEKSDGPAA